MSSRAFPVTVGSIFINESVCGVCALEIVSSRRGKRNVLIFFTKGEPIFYIVAIELKLYLNIEPL
jgi:hypothetical protein